MNIDDAAVLASIGRAELLGSRACELKDHKQKRFYNQYDFSVQIEVSFPAVDSFTGIVHRMSLKHCCTHVV